MNDILNKSLNLIDEILNGEDAKSDKFYDKLALKISSIFNNQSFLIYFLQDIETVLKSGCKNGKLIKNYKANDTFLSCLYDNKTKIFETKSDKILSDFTLVGRLAIKNSIFGYCILSFDKMPSEDEITAFVSLCSTVSYKIKDYELNGVFKIQLKAMQDAFIEKENALLTVKKQHKKLLEIDKTKNLFLANISHELRTPLNAIIGFSQALSSKIFGPLNEKQNEYIKDIQISSLHLLGMINEILDISKIEANAIKFNPSEISPKQAIEEVANIVEPLLKDKKINLDFKSDFDGLIYADYQKFQQILYNLISNAIKFSNEKGEIEITSAQNANNYILTIKDYGIGIDKKHHNKIFKKFVHLEDNFKNGIKNQSSTGLGLAITKELVKLHKGKINLKSEIGKGTSFEIIFKGAVL